jgi:DNA-directed RNA polymerase specialized sigma24 family protein
VWDSAITGRATGGRTTIPVQCELVERAVNKLYVTERASRDMILLHYLKGGSAREKVKRLGVSCQNYYARLERAEYAVKIEIGY